MDRPDVAGCEAHKVVESQRVLLDWVVLVVEGELPPSPPPPPQLANNAVRVSKMPVQSVDRIQEFSE
jgi:hypothetical protein